MTIYEELQRAQDEASEVQPIYKWGLEKALEKTGNLDKSRTAIKGNTDGLVSAIYYANGNPTPFLILIECKLNQSLQEDVFRAQVILQVICYLKQIREKGEDTPLVALIGTKKECFALSTKVLLPYANQEIIGYSSASNAYKSNPGLVMQIIGDTDIQEGCNIYDITPSFSLSEVAKEIITLAEGNPFKQEITEQSISKDFDYFSMRVIKPRQVYEGLTQYLPGRIQKDLFMRMLLTPDECYLHPKKKDKAIFGVGNERDVNSSAFLAFQASHEFKYSLEEKKKFTEICDRLIEDADRRNKGDFYTPTVWVDECHKLMCKELGEDWKDKYIVWDCCCGTKNLTRDYKFRQLYSSTIEEGDIEIGKRYNLDNAESHNVAFVYDFLNDDVDLFEELLEKKKNGEPLTEFDFVDSKLYYRAPGLVRGLLNGKPLVFLINPPYGTAKNGGRDSISKAGIAKTEVNEIMLKDKIGASAQQLYIQFLYRIIRIKLLFNVDIKIGLFSPPAFISGSSFKGFRQYMIGKLGVCNGFLLQGNQFADVSDSWGISFTIWKEGYGLSDIALNVLKAEVGVAKYLSTHTIYNLDNKNTLSDWIKVKGQGIDAPQLSSAIGIKQTGRGKLVPNALGYMMFNANNIEQSKQFVTLLSSCASGANGVSVLGDNFFNCMSGFVARRIMINSCNWINCKDEYMIPNVEHPQYPQWESDCVIYSLFNTASNQSSLRNIEYNNKTWNIKNEFFFMSEQEIKDLASGKCDRDNVNGIIEEDIQKFGGERFVFKKLQKITLSPDAQAVLDKAKELVRLSFKERALFDMQHPEYQINTWDSGWYQIKGLLKEYHPKELEDFNKLYKALEDRMRPLVYELGFLYQ